MRSLEDGFFGNIDGELVIRHAVPHDPDIGITQLIEQLELFAADVLPFCRTL